MELTRHAAVRKQQRGFQADDVELIIRFGTCIKRPGNVIEYHMAQKNEKHLVQAIDRVKGKSVLVSDDEETVITVYNRIKYSGEKRRRSWRGGDNDGKISYRRGVRPKYCAS